MQETTNYKLKKQELSDPADITQISGNWDTIDTKLKELETKSTELAAENDRLEESLGTTSGDLTTGLDKKLDKAGGTVTGNLKVQGMLETDQVIRSIKAEYLQAQADVVKGTAPIETKYSYLSVFDRNGWEIAKNRLAHIDYMVGADKAATLALSVNKFEAGSTEDAVSIFAKWNADGTPRVYLSHNPKKDSNSQDIATTGWVKGLAATTSEAGLVKLADENDALAPTDPSAVVNMPLLYELGDYRRISTAYKLGDTVACAFQFDYYLECTQAGTTSATTLDTRNVTAEQEIADGSAKWTVRRTMLKVSGATIDETGTLDLSDYATKDYVTEAVSTATESTKEYVDNSIESTKEFVTEKVEEAVTSGIDLSKYAKLDAANTFTAANTFNAGATIKGTATLSSASASTLNVSGKTTLAGGVDMLGTCTAPNPTEDNHVATKSYVDSKVASGGSGGDLSNYVTLDGAQTITGAKTFSELPKTTDTTVPSADGDLITKKYFADNAARKEGTNTFTGNNTFSNPVTVGTPTANTHAATKAYVDSKISSGGDGDLSNYVTLDSAQIITGKKTFSGGLDVNSTAMTVEAPLRASGFPEDIGNESKLNISMTKVKFGSVEGHSSVPMNVTFAEDCTPISNAEITQAKQLVTKEYVDNKVAGAGGSGEDLSEFIQKIDSIGNKRFNIGPKLDLNGSSIYADQIVLGDITDGTLNELRIDKKKVSLKRNCILEYAVAPSTFTNNQVVTKAYVDNAVANDSSNNVLNGYITLADAVYTVDPKDHLETHKINQLEFVPKNDEGSSIINISTQVFSLSNKTSPQWSGTPTISNHLVNKKYVDAKVSEAAGNGGAKLSYNSSFDPTQAINTTTGGSFMMKDYIYGDTKQGLLTINILNTNQSVSPVTKLNITAEEGSIRFLTHDILPETDGKIRSSVITIPFTAETKITFSTTGSLPTSYTLGQFVMFNVMTFG